jgi:hypothetical protein
MVPSRAVSASMDEWRAGGFFSSLPSSSPNQNVLIDWLDVLTSDLLGR